MITYTKQIVPSQEDEARLDLLGNAKNILFFDIETTGFNRTNDHIISITFMYYDKHAWQIKQLFAESTTDEILLLSESASIFDDKEIHITYNGNAFDIPFLNAKYSYYNISAALNKSKSYDLYRIAKATLSLDNYKLKSIEKYLNIERIDQISGLECIANYKSYLSTKDLQYANLILDHNYEDVLNLLSLTKIIDFLSPEMLNSFKVRYFCNNSKLYYIDSQLLKNDYLEIRLWHYNKSKFQLGTLNSSNFYYDNGTQIVNEKENILLIKVPIYTKDIEGVQLVFIDYESFDNTHLKLDDIQQAIIQYNEYFINDNIIGILKSLFEKASI